MKCVSRAVAAMVLAFLVACGGRVSPDAKVEPLPAAIQDVIDKVDKDPVWDGADIGLAIRGAKLADMVNSINALPPESRQVLVGVSKANGKLEDNGNYYIEFDDLPSNRATGVVKRVTAQWTKEGKLDLGAELSVSGAVKLHGHYKPLNVGGRIGVQMGSDAALTGQMTFAPSPDSFLNASFTLNPSHVDWSIKTAIEDEKKVCVSATVPCPTLAKPLRTCVQGGCATLWQYKIPISISDSVAIQGQLLQLPIKLMVPQEFLVDTKVGDVPFRRSLALAVKPVSFASDARGLFMKLGVDVQKKPDPKTAQIN